MASFSYPFNKGYTNQFDSNFDPENHEEFAERLRKTFYYGKNPTTDRPSMPLTDIAVEYFQEAAPRQLDKLDHYTAATTSRQACMSSTSVVNGMIYVKRLKQKNTAYLHKISSSDLFFISVMMASKFLYDEGIDDEVFNDEWAASADMETEDVNELEREFLSAIDWQLFVKQNEFLTTLNNLEKRIALRQGLDRGWFSYTDLMVLSHDPDFSRLVAFISSEMSKVVVVSCVAYIAGLLTMIGSTVLVSMMSSTLVVHAPIMFAPALPQIQENKLVCNQTVTETKVALEEDQKQQVFVSVHQDVPSGPVENEGTDHQLEKRASVKSVVRTILSQLLAVVTLKGSSSDCFTSSSRHKDRLASSSNSYKEQHADNVFDSSTMLCALGPCLSNSPRLCQNVTSNSAYGIGTLKGNLLVQSHGCVGCSRFRQTQPGLHNMNCYVDIPQVVKCCCSGRSESRMYNVEEVLHDRFSDLSVGFTTGIGVSRGLHIQT